MLEIAPLAILAARLVGSLPVISTATDRKKSTSSTAILLRVPSKSAIGSFDAPTTAGPTSLPNRGIARPRTWLRDVPSSPSTDAVQDAMDSSSPITADPCGYL